MNISCTVMSFRSRFLSPLSETEIMLYIWIYSSKTSGNSVRRQGITVRWKGHREHANTSVDIIPLTRSETTVSWQGTEFYTYTDIDIICLNRSSTTVSWQGTEFCTHMELILNILYAGYW